jgi:hypothetical protein
MTAEADDRILLQAVAVLARRATACVDVLRTLYDDRADEAAADRLYRVARAAERISASIEAPEVAAAAESGPMAVIRLCEADRAVVDWHCARSRDRWLR